MGRGHHPVLRHEDGPAPVADGADDGILQLYGDLAEDSCKLACLMTQFVTNNKLIIVFCGSFMIFTVTSSPWENRKNTSQHFRVTLSFVLCETCHGQESLLVTSPLMILAESSELSRNCSGFGRRKFAKSGLSPQSGERTLYWEMFKYFILIK